MAKDFMSIIFGSESDDTLIVLGEEEEEEEVEEKGEEEKRKEEDGVASIGEGVECLKLDKEVEEVKEELEEGEIVEASMEEMEASMKGDEDLGIMMESLGEVEEGEERCVSVDLQSEIDGSSNIKKFIKAVTFYVPCTVSWTIVNE